MASSMWLWEAMLAACWSPGQRLLRRRAQPARPFIWKHALWISMECTSLTVILNYVVYLNLIEAGSQSITFTFKNSIVTRWGQISDFQCCFFTDITHFISKFSFLLVTVYCRDSQTFSVHSTLIITVICSLSPQARINTK